MATSHIIKTGRERLKLTPQEFGDAIGVTRAAVQQWESGKTAPTRKHQPRVAGLLGISVAELMAQDGPLPSLPAPVPALASHSPAPTPAPGETGILVPMLSNSASMGAGADLHDEDVIAGAIALSPTFVHDHLRPTSAGALRFLHGYGDSMSPTFNSGDVLLVDTGVTDPKIDGIYVLQAHGRLFVKRVRQRLDGSHEISSDNPAHKTVDVLNGDHAIIVCGRVIWKWVGGKV